MKTKFLLLLSILAFFFGGCTDKETSDLKLDRTSFNVGSGAGSVTIEINTTYSWKILNDSRWCTPDKTTGENDGQVTFTIEPNITTSARTARITVSSHNLDQIVEITQDAGSGEEYHYKLPVVFHILYNDPDNEKQYVRQGWLPQILAICNQMYANTFDNGDTGKNSVDMNLEFVMATTDPEGKILPELGIDRVYWEKATMDAEEFMKEKSQDYADLVWDLNKYINIFVYTFTEQNTGGISHLPYATEANPLDGLVSGETYLSNPKTTYPHGISINNDYIYSLPPKGMYVSTDISSTLAHELGHYLGLLHAFGQTRVQDNKTINWEDDTDYCDDTPHYDRDAYEDWLYNVYYIQHPSSSSRKFSEMIERTDINGVTFKGRNIMDYFYCWSNEFTAGQRARVRHVLEYSPLVPGPKYDQRLTRSTGDMEIPPIRTIK